MDGVYVIITAAKNEEDYIEKTIQSVISQNILPKKWIIVSDGSTDGTDEIVKKYMAKYDFIHFIRLENSNPRNFGSQALAQIRGIEQLKGIDYEYIGMLDADISFGKEYYEDVLSEFQEDPKLGIGGGVLFVILNGKHKKCMSSQWHVTGGIQLFRKQCYEDIGGLIPLEKGGFDSIAVIMARMKGWKVKKIKNIRVFHNRPEWSAKGNIIGARFRQGILDFSLGYHPIYSIFKFIYRIKEKPFLLSSLLRISGYFFALIKGESSDLPVEVIEYLRKEQMQRIKKIVFRMKRSTLYNLK